RRPRRFVLIVIVVGRPAPGQPGNDPAVMTNVNRHQPTAHAMHDTTVLYSTSTSRISSSRSGGRSSGTSTTERCVPQADRGRGEAQAGGKTALLGRCIEPYRLRAQQWADTAER